LAVDALVVRFQVSGITDDGAKGAGTAKEATSITCTNTGSTTTGLQVKLYQYNGTLLHTTTINAVAQNTYTISTQQTALYFDDVYLDSDGIYQGSARILSDSPAIICTAQVLDPLGSKFMDKLTYDGHGYLVKISGRVFALIK
jgi:hypothetical protein